MFKSYDEQIQDLLNRIYEEKIKKYKDIPLIESLNDKIDALKEEQRLARQRDRRRS